MDIKKLFEETIDNVDPVLKEKYWDGKWNRIVRHYFYIKKGVEEFNFFRYIILSVGIIYAYFNFTNLWLFPIMLFCCLPCLDLTGYISVHRVDKVMEFLQVRYATHYSHYNIEIQEHQKSDLKEMRKDQKRLIRLIRYAIKHSSMNTKNESITKNN